jgi:hypothetical protein
MSTEAPTLSSFAVNDRERAVIELLDSKSYREIAAELSISKSTVGDIASRVKRRAAKQGYSPEHDMTRPCPSTHYVKGTSTLYNEQGEQVLQWVKTTADQDRLTEMAQEMAAAACESVTPIKPSKRKTPAIDADRLTVYPIGDAHVGLYAWNEDAEEDWNCDIVEQVMLDSFGEVLAGSSDTEQCLLINLGDWFHTDTPENQTRRSGHALDVDTRWSRVVQVGVRLMRSLIDACLTKHEQVRVINEIGNHDDQSAVMLSAVLAAVYEREPRVEIDQSPDVFHWHEFGQNLIGVHHGHKCKPDQLYRVMAEDQREACGRCVHRYWYTGHIHHQRTVDVGGQQIESFRTIIPRDNYAHSNGYRGQRSICSITLDRERGECARKVVNIPTAARRESL